MKKSFLISLILLMSVNIFAQERAWKKAHKKHSVEAYKEFLAKYPKTETYSEVAEGWIIMLEFVNTFDTLQTIQACEDYHNKYPNSELSNNMIQISTILKSKYKPYAEQLGEANKIKIDKIKEIGSEEFTEEQFFNINWSPVDPYLGKIGILRINGFNNDSLKHHEITLGYQSDFYLIPETRLTKGIQDLFDIFYENIDNTQILKYEYMNVTNIEKIFQPDSIVTITFENGIFSDIKWFK